MHRVVIIGGGFGGLYAAKKMAGKEVDVTLVDRRNFHLFQPLLYQVATGGLSPGDIASPLRVIFSKHKNIKILRAEMIDLLPDEKKVVLDSGSLEYDSLIIATGMRNIYFGNDDWKQTAPGLKSIENALDVRGRVFEAFEQAEKETDSEEIKRLLRFVIIGGGPTGVELAGALGELCQYTLKRDFRRIRTDRAEIILVEGGDKILETFHDKLIARAGKDLESFGVSIRTNTFVTDIKNGAVQIKTDEGSGTIEAGTIIWAAGVGATELTKTIAYRSDVQPDKSGRLPVNGNLTVGNTGNVYAVGDIARFERINGTLVPGVATAAMQQGRFVARRILHLVRGKKDSNEKFEFRDKGSLAVIGRNSAVAQFGRVRLTGFFAWIVWVFVHIGYLAEFDNRLIVMLQWSINYFVHKRGARLITGRQAEADDRHRVKKTEIKPPAEKTP